MSGNQHITPGAPARVLFYVAGDGKIAIVINDRPGSPRIRVKTVGAESIAGYVRTGHEFPHAAEVHIHGIDPAAGLIPRDQEESVVPNFFGGPFVVVAQRECIGVGLVVEQVSYAGQPEDVAREINIGFRFVARILLPPTVHVGPAGVDGLNQLAADTSSSIEASVPCGAVILTVKDTGGRTTEAVLYCRVARALRYEEFLTILAIAPGLFLDEVEDGRDMAPGRSAGLWCRSVRVAIV